MADKLKDDAHASRDDFTHCGWLPLSGSEKLRINPRETWYSNVEAVTPNGDYEVTLHLKQPRPGRYRRGHAAPARRAVGSAAGDSKNTAGPACIRMREALVTAGAHSESTGAA
jgi:hypothetical protein